MKPIIVISIKIKQSYLFGNNPLPTFFVPFSFLYRLVTLPPPHSGDRYIQPGQQALHFFLLFSTL